MNAQELREALGHSDRIHSFLNVEKSGVIVAAAAQIVIENTARTIALPILEAGEFLSWLADRLVNVYGESENVDFVRKLRQLAALGDSR